MRFLNHCNLQKIRSGPQKSAQNESKNHSAIKNRTHCDHQIFSRVRKQLEKGEQV